MATPPDDLGKCCDRRWKPPCCPVLSLQLPTTPTVARSSPDATGRPWAWMARSLHQSCGLGRDHQRSPAAPGRHGLLYRVGLLRPSPLSPAPPSWERSSPPEAGELTLLPRSARWQQGVAGGLAPLPTGRGRSRDQDRVAVKQSLRTSVVMALANRKRRRDTRSFLMRRFP